VNDRIRTLRTERNWTQQELGDLLGVTAQAVSKWETGLAAPDIALLPKLSALFRCSIDSLFGTEKVIGARDSVTKVEGRPGVRCSFCGMHQDDVWRLIRGLWSIHLLGMRGDVWRHCEQHEKGRGCPMNKIMHIGTGESGNRRWPVAVT